MKSANLIIINMQSLSFVVCKRNQLLKPCTHIPNKRRTNGDMWMVPQKRTSDGEYLCLHLVAVPRMLVNWANVKECLFVPDDCVTICLLAFAMCGRWTIFNKPIWQTHEICWRMFILRLFGICVCGLKHMKKIAGTGSASEEWYFGTYFATCPTVSLCDLSGVILHQKWI